MWKKNPKHLIALNVDLQKCISVEKLERLNDVCIVKEINENNETIQNDNHSILYWNLSTLCNECTDTTTVVTEIYPNTMSFIIFTITATCYKNISLCKSLDFFFWKKKNLYSDNDMMRNEKATTFSPNFVRVSIKLRKFIIICMIWKMEQQITYHFYGYNTIRKRKEKQ